MLQDCVYNSSRDVAEVVPFGALDLAKAYASGSVPATLEASAEDFNGIEDPASISGKPSDAFDALAMGKGIEEREASKSSE